MFGSTRNTAADAAVKSKSKDEKQTIGRTLLEARRATRDTLPKRLLTRSDGRPVAIVQLGLLDPKAMTPEALTQTTGYLKSRQRAGGHEKLLQTNTLAVIEDLQQGLDALIADGVSNTTNISVKDVLASVRAAAQDEKRAFDSHIGDLREAYAHVEQSLHKYQESALSGDGQSSGGGLFGLLKRVLGGAVTMAEATQSFNDRESIGIDLDAHLAGGDVLARLMGDCDAMLRGLETAVVVAQSESATITSHIVQIEREANTQAQADFNVNTRVVALALNNPARQARQIAELMRHVREHGSDDLAARAANIVKRDVATLLDGVDVTQLVELEASQTRMQNVDADETQSTQETMVDPRAARAVAAEELLRLIDQRPSTLLTSTAHSREFAVQIHEKGRPLFERAPFITAEYRGASSVAAFMHIEVGVALNELLTLHEGDARFREALRKREFFVLEDMVDWWRDEHEHERVNSTNTPDDLGDDLLIRGLTPSVNGNVNSSNSSSNSSAQDGLNGRGKQL